MLAAINLNTFLSFPNGIITQTLSKHKQFSLLRNEAPERHATMFNETGR